MLQSNSMQNWFKNTVPFGWKFILQLVFVVIVAFIGTRIASKAATPTPPEQPLAKESSFWQNDQSTNAPGNATTSSSTTSATPTTEQQTNPTAQPPEGVSASSYLVADLKSGQILAQKKPEKKLPVASLTKLMTAVVATETMSPQTDVMITEEAASTYGNTDSLQTGASFALSQLFYPLLLESSNDTATAIAQHDNQSKFLDQMNRKALALNMDSTHFADPTGLSKRNKATAVDLLKLARYIQNNHKFIFDITNTSQKSLTTINEGGEILFANKNPLHRQEGFIGGKNGYTDSARYTALSVFAAKEKEVEKPTAVIVLSTENPEQDTKRLLRWSRQH